MKKLEFKQFGIGSLFKVTAYMMIVPLALFFFIGVIVTLVSVIAGIRQILFIGIIYMAMPIVMIPIYGLISMLTGLIYNWLAGKFGGLVIFVQEENDVSEANTEHTL